MQTDTIKALIAEKYKSANESIHYSPETRQAVIKAMDRMLDVFSTVTNITSEELKELCPNEEECERNRDAKMWLAIGEPRSELLQRLKED